MRKLTTAQDIKNRMTRK